uniref:Uncharacterized protein n=1 Tax=Lepeophtheirus salmonis TaxID=72036 RepID=A0A0K2V4H0_LEPSM
MGSGTRDLHAVASSAKLALLELCSPFSSTARTLVRLQKAEQYGLCLCLGLVEVTYKRGKCVRVRDPIIKSGFNPTKFWFSVVPTLPFTSLDNGCATVSPLDHPELDKDTSSKIAISPRDEQGA